jgi:hypothetical protein
MPQAWARTIDALWAVYDRGGRLGPPPPVPLILAGWVYSNDVEKAHRWRQTVAWAVERGYAELIPSFPAAEQYSAWAMSTYAVGPGGGPMYLPWDFSVKVRPTEQAVAEALDRLRTNWADVAGRPLADVSWPVGFTGRKRRRLVIKADGQVKPSWGEWHMLAPDERRRAFTRLRAAENGAIAPLEVDHIDFDTSS